MAQQQERRIKTPWRVQWVRFRSQAVPALTLTGCVIVAGWLWSRHVGSGNATGAVEIVRASVASDADGVLAPLPGDALDLYSRVKAGDLIARLDEGPLQRQRAARQLEVDRLQKQLADAQKAGGDAAAAESLRLAVEGAEEDVAQIDLKLQAVDIRSPITGTIVRVYRRPGQIVQVGQPIFDLAADQGAFIISFIRPDQRIAPARGMNVQVRPAATPRLTYVSRVQDVGGQVDLVPANLLRDPKVPEWGLPVRVPVPPEANLKPGEVVNLVFQTTAPGA